MVGHATQFTQSGAQTWSAYFFQGQTCAGADARAGETSAGANSRAFILRGICLAFGFNSLFFVVLVVPDWSREVFALVLRLSFSALLVTRCASTRTIS